MSWSTHGNLGNLIICLGLRARELFDDSVIGGSLLLANTKISTMSILFSEVQIAYLAASALLGRVGEELLEGLTLEAAGE